MSQFFLPGVVVVKPIRKQDFKSFLYMMLVAAFGGFIVAVLGILFGTLVFNGNSFGGFGDLVAAIMGMIIGYPFGVVLGIAIFGRVFKYQGLLWLAILGSIAGIAVAFTLAEPLKLNSNSGLLLGSIVVLTPLLATWGFHAKKQGRT